MWVPKLLLPPVKIRFVGPKKANLAQNMLSWADIGLAGSFGALLVVVVRAVSRKTHIYFIVELDISHSIVALVISAQVGFFTFNVSSYHKKHRRAQGPASSCFVCEANRRAVEWVARG